MDDVNQPVVNTDTNKSQTKIYLIVGVIALALILLGLIIAGAFTKKTNPGENQQTSEQNPDLLQTKQQIATDPNFPEVIGKLLPGAPQLPVYPGATLVGSAKTNKAEQTDTGYRIKWKSNADVPMVMSWYEQELPKVGWRIEHSDDPSNAGEQVNKISSANFNGSLGVEAGEDGTEIVVDVRVN